MSEETGIQNLFRRMKMTYYCRFNASRRLKRHETLSLWTISLFSIGLIVLPVASAIGLQVNSSAQVLKVLEVASAIVILVYSIIVNKSDYSHRSERHHQCGLELNALNRIIFKMKDRDVSDDELDQYNSKYEEILDRYENHSNLDFFNAKVESFPQFYNIGSLQRVMLWVWSSLEYVQYLILMVAQIVLFYYVFT